MGEQRMPSAAPAKMVAVTMELDYAPRGHVILAAIEILLDGKTRSAEELLARRSRASSSPRTRRASTCTPR